jgi:hypothetical protein
MKKKNSAGNCNPFKLFRVIIIKRNIFQLTFFTDFFALSVRTESVTPTSGQPK